MKCSVKAAKADSEEIDNVQNYFNLLETLWGGRFISDDEDWVNWDDDDEDKKELLEIKEELKEFEGEEDNRIIVYEFLKRKYRKIDYCGSFGRVMMNAAILLEKVCDPDLDYLDYNKKIKEALEYYDKMHPDENPEEGEQTE